MTRRIHLSEVGALTRRRAVACIGAAPAMLAFTARAASADPFTISQGNFRPLPIAFPDFLADSPADAEVARAILQIIVGNLVHSKGHEMFELMDQAAFPEKTIGVDSVPHFDDWRAIKAQVLLAGSVTHPPNGGMDVGFRLWDVLTPRQLIGQLYHTKSDDFRRVANLMSDMIYERLTGEKGNFDASTSP